MLDAAPCKFGSIIFIRRAQTMNRPMTLMPANPYPADRVDPVRNLVHTSRSVLLPVLLAAVGVGAALSPVRASPLADALLTSAEQLPVAAEEAEPRIDLGDLRWLLGCWHGEAFGDAADECWVSAPNGRLTGLFQLLDGPNQRFSEIFVLDVFDGTPELRLKHFHPDLTGWEDKDGFIRFRLLETGPDFARFDGLLYRLEADGTLVIELRMRRDGVVVTETMRFRRQP